MRTQFLASILTGAYPEPSSREVCRCDDLECTHYHERPKPPRTEPYDDDPMDDCGAWGVELRDTDE